MAGGEVNRVSFLPVFEVATSICVTDPLSNQSETDTKTFTSNNVGCVS